jgi:phospholipid/cholesterol/gamma-HCH transport system substrate-binding protein
MNTKQNEFIIGIIISFAIVLLVAATLWLGKTSFFTKGIQLNLIVQNADGIQKGDEIYFRGVKIGNVLESSILKNGVLLNLKIDELNKIPIDSKFEISDFSLISGKAIQITPGTSEKYFQPQDTVLGSSAYGVNQAIETIKDLSPKIEKVLTNLDALTGKDVKDKVVITLNNLNGTISQLKNQVDGNLKNILANVNEITSNNKNNIDSLFLSLNNNSIELSKFLNKSSTAVEQLNSLLTSINEGKGSIGGIVNNDSLYHNLNHSIASIDSLVTDIKQNPKKYINVSVF